jgi:hypothetical protein
MGFDAGEFKSYPAVLPAFLLDPGDRDSTDLAYMGDMRAPARL